LIVDSVAIMHTYIGHTVHHLGMNVRRCRVSLRIKHDPNTIEERATYSNTARTTPSKQPSNKCSILGIIHL